MKILVTGGEGFIAKNIKESFSNPYKVVALNSKELNLLDTEKVESVIKKGKFDAVVHTATYDAAPKTSTKDKTKVLENNIRMYYNVARLKDHFGKMIFFGSGAEFDREHWKNGMKESYFDRYVPSDSYGLSKYLMTKNALNAKNVYNLRLFGVFGKYEDWRYRFVSNMCFQALTTNKLVIQQNAFYDFTHVDDVLKVVKWVLLNKPDEKVYNVCSGKAFERKAVAEIIRKLSGKELKIIIKNKKKGPEYSGSSKLLLSDFKKMTFTPLEKSVESLYNWYAKHKNELFK